FTFGPPIFQSNGLFGRGTRVDRALIEGENPPRAYLLKDAWRQARRHSEARFYDLIQSYVAKSIRMRSPSDWYLRQERRSIQGISRPSYIHG
ncbi:hypothetical protein FB451DRAFT_1017261, partial [Mycena latifolia]